MKFAIGYLATFAAFCILDFAWLGWIARSFYRSQIGALLLAQPNWMAAAVFYVFYTAGIQVFCVAPAFEAGSALKAVTFGALFGFFCYMTYDLSNLATLKGWTTNLSVMDIAWGSILTSLAATAGYAAAQALTRTA
ncbi:MAG: DUF2177 family protein [Betaproteobacteria bacterium]